MVNLDDYLKSSKMCDSDNPIIIQKAQNLTNEVSSDKEKAIAIFNYIRDDVEFFMDPYFETASNTLKAVKGFCASKANLQVALLRAVNIPARYHIFHVKKELMKPFMPNWLLKFFPDNIDHHPTCECYLNEKWIACDATFDKKLIEGAKKKENLNQEAFPQIDWDGENNLNTLYPWKVAEEGYFASLDEFWRATIKRCYSPKFMMKILLPFGNKYMKKVRIY